MRKIIVAVTFIITCIHVFAQDIKRIDNFIGDWRADKVKVFAQVYQVKDGEYKVNLTNDLTLREAPIAILNAQKTAPNTLSISGSGWTGKINKNELYLEKGNVSYKKIGRASCRERV